MTRENCAGFWFLTIAAHPNPSWSVTVGLCTPQLQLQPEALCERQRNETERSRFPRIPHALLCTRLKCRMCFSYPKQISSSNFRWITRIAGFREGPQRSVLGLWELGYFSSKSKTNNKNIWDWILEVWAVLPDKKSLKKREQNLSREGINHQNILSKSCCFCHCLQSLNQD